MFSWQGLVGSVQLAVFSGQCSVFSWKLVLRQAQDDSGKQDEKLNSKLKLRDSSFVGMTACSEEFLVVRL